MSAATLAYRVPGLRRALQVLMINCRHGPDMWKTLYPLLSKPPLRAQRMQGCCRQQGHPACPNVASKNARHGDPSRQAETTSVMARQRLKQSRRLHGLAAGLEWQPILKAPGYDQNFGHWLLQWPCFEQIPLRLPPLEFVRDVGSFDHFDYTALARQGENVRANTYKFKVTVDAWQHGSHLSFVRIRPPPNPPFAMVERQVAWEARQTAQPAFHCRELETSHPDTFMCTLVSCTRGSRHDRAKLTLRSLLHFQSLMSWSTTGR